MGRAGVRDSSDLKLGVVEREKYAIWRIEVSTPWCYDGAASRFTINHRYLL